MFETYYEEERELEIRGTYDVIVAGSGPAGVAAALAAGRRGMRVLLIEALGRVGGISTSGLMSHWTGSVRSSLYDELWQRAADKNAFERGKPKKQIDPELLTVTYYEMLQEANVEILLYTFVCGVMRFGNDIVDDRDIFRDTAFYRVSVFCYCLDVAAVKTELSGLCTFLHSHLFTFVFI